MRKKNHEDDPKDDKTNDIAVEIKSTNLEEIVNAALGVYMVPPATPSK